MHGLKQSFKHISSLKMNDSFHSRPALRFSCLLIPCCVAQLLSKTASPGKYSPTRENVGGFAPSSAFDHPLNVPQIARARHYRNGRYIPSVVRPNTGEDDDRPKR